MLVSHPSRIWRPEKINNKNRVQYSSCGKIQIWEIATGDTIEGYILLENERTKQLKVHLADDDVVNIPSLTYSMELNTWTFPTSMMVQDTPHNVSEYSPIHIFFSESGSMLFIMHKFVRTVSRKIMIEIRTSMCS